MSYFNKKKSCSNHTSSAYHSPVKLRLLLMVKRVPMVAPFHQVKIFLSTKA